MNERWRELADGVLVRRHASLDLNVGLVVGDGACLVVDTRSSEPEGRELADAVRRVTSAPWSVALTHAHYDHYFGTASFLPAAVWAHRDAAGAVAACGEATRSRIAGLYERDGQPEVAAEIAATRLIAPDRLVERSTVLDVGGRRVELWHLGRGHTAGDLVVHVPDADVVLAGDLVEESAPPQFGDAFPLDWPATLDALLAGRPPGLVVPGHGDVVDVAFVRAQRDLLADLARRCREAHAERRPAQDVAGDCPDLGTYALQAVERTYWQLDNEPEHP